MSDIIAGQLVRILNYSGSAALPTGGFQDANSTLVDPATITLKVKQPGGTTTTYSTTDLTKDGVGLYHLDVDTTALPGTWEFAWSSGGPQTYQPASFVVDPAPL